MTIAIKIIIILIIYTLSAYKVYKFKQIEYSKGGASQNDKLDMVDMFETFTPILNSFYAMIFIFDSPYDENCRPEKNKNNFLNKFFKIKK